MKKILASLLVLGSATQITWAQSDLVRPSSIGFSFLLNDFATAQKLRNGSLGQVIRENGWASPKEMDAGIAVTYFKGLHKVIDFAGTLGASVVKNPLPNRPASSNQQVFLAADASFNFKMFPDNFWVSPYLIAGVGGTKYGNYYGAFVPLGGGLKINLSENTTIFLTQTYRIPVTTDNINYHFATNLGVAMPFGERKVEQPKPAPPPPPPADTDKDGILDNVDKCPTVAGVAKYEGCPVPDTDKDGINDDEDKCPTVAGTARYQGCPVPDTDKDGINDEEDKCPTVAGVAKYQGCPVPDGDSDGVNDEEDKCPTVPGTRENGGCPEIKQEVINRVNYAAKNISFVTGSAKLTAKSLPVLNEVVKILNENPELKISIDGHTDNVGKADYNLSLSENRANSVRDYLVSKGVDASRLTATGYGLTQPVADNKTAAGRAKNRRVEMKLGY